MKKTPKLLGSPERPQDFRRGLLAWLAVTLVCVSARGCNLFPQYSQSQTDSGSNCRATSVGFRNDGVFSWDGKHNPTCQVDASGHAVMSYDVEANCAEPNPWRSCVVAKHQDFTAFVSGHGVYEVNLCVDGPLPGSLSLKVEYDPSADAGAEQRQLYLTLIQPSDALSSGCTRSFFRASDLSLPSQCAARTDALTCAPGDTSPKTITPLPTSEPGIHDAQFLLTTEFCDPSRLTSSTPTLTVTLNDVIYYPDACHCTTSTDCASGSYCDQDGWPELACCRCSNDCGGVCRGAE